MKVIMNKLSEKIKTYMEKNNFSSLKCAKNLGISDATLEKILNNSQDLELTPEEIDRINIAIDQKKDSKNKRIIKFFQCTDFFTNTFCFKIIIFRTS